ncbi:hypothetical protein PFISCL1PPCAC_29069, partial [Pristionchus fissidentatus]
KAKIILEFLPLEILSLIVNHLGYRDRFALRETSAILDNVITSLAKSPLESLPLHVLLRIISHLGIRDRFNLRATSGILEEAISQSHLDLSRCDKSKISIEQQNKTLTIKIVGVQEGCIDSAVAKCM